jgi:type IV secretory pathway VirB2 component (pilin)
MGMLGTMLQRLFGSRTGNVLLAIAVVGLVMSGFGFHAHEAYITGRLATIGYIANGIKDFHRSRQDAMKRELREK